MQRLSRVVLKNSAIGMAAQLAIKALSFIFTVYVVRELGPSEYGQYAGVTAFGALFIFISDLGLSPYLVREVARVRDAADGQQRIGELFGNVLALRLALSVLAGVMMVVAAWLTGRPALMVGAIALNAVSVLIYSIHGTSDSVLAGYERLDISSLVRVINQVIFVAGGALILTLGFGYYGLIVTTIVGVCVMAAICWRSMARLGVRAGRVLASSWPALLRASIPFGMIGFTLGLSYKFDSVLLNIYRGDAETGFYNAAYNLVFSAVMVSNVLNTALYPSLTRQVATDPSGVTAIYGRVLRYLLMVALPIAVGLSVLSGDIVTFLYDTSYTESASVLQLIIWVVPLMYTSEFLGYVVLISGRERAAARSVFVSTGFNVAANLIVVPTIGLVGAAVVTVVTEAVLVLQYIWILREQLSAVDWRRALVLPACAAALMGAVALLLAGVAPLLVTIAVAGVVYLALLLALRVIGPEELRFVRGLRAARSTTATP